MARKILTYRLHELNIFDSYLSTVRLCSTKAHYFHTGETLEPQQEIDELCRDEFAYTCSSSSGADETVAGTFLVRIYFRFTALCVNNLEGEQ